MIIALAADHAGFEQKEELKFFLQDEGYEVVDRGPSDNERVDYPDYAHIVADDVAKGRADRGILVCGTGIGMAIAANKTCGIRAANVIDPRFAELTRAHNDANILCLSGRFIDIAANKIIVSVFLETSFQGGRHADRVEKIEHNELKI